MIYCNNCECKFNEALEKPFVFSFGRLTSSLGDPVKGKCKFSDVELYSAPYEDENYKLEQPVCRQRAGFCLFFQCASNNGEGECSRQDILVDSSLITHQFLCKCFSVRKLSGHIDWSRNLQSNGTAKGGHIDDAYAQKMNNDNKKFKSFSNGHRDAKEPTKKK
jgi:hypothetical protein